MVPPEIQSSTGILSLSFHTDMAVAKDGFSARYNMTHKEVSESKSTLQFKGQNKGARMLTPPPPTVFSCSVPLQ